MRTSFLTTFCMLVGMVSTARADFLPPPFATHAISQDGSVVARVKPGKWTKDNKRDPKDQITLYSFDADRDAFVRTARFDLGDLRPSERLYVSNDGRHLILVNIGHWIGEDALGIRVYNRDGELLKRWKLPDFLTPEQIEASAKTGSTTQWFDDGAFTKDTFSFYGPAQFIKGWGSSFTIMRGAKEGVSYSFTIDLETMKLNKE